MSDKLSRDINWLVISRKVVERNGHRVCQIRCNRGAGVTRLAWTLDPYEAVEVDGKPNYVF